MSTGYESGRWTREGDDEDRSVEGKAREDRYVDAVRNRSLARKGNLLHEGYHTVTRGNAPGELLSPFGVDSGEVCTALLPLGLPNSTAIEGSSIQVRAFQRIELLLRKVQRCLKLTGRRERIEIRCMDKGVIAVRPASGKEIVGLWDVNRGRERGDFTSLGLRSNGSRCKR